MEDRGAGISISHFFFCRTSCFSTNPELGFVTPGLKGQPSLTNLCEPDARHAVECRFTAGVRDHAGYIHCGERLGSLQRFGDSRGISYDPVSYLDRDGFRPKIDHPSKPRLAGAPTATSNMRRRLRGLFCCLSPIPPFVYLAVY